MSLQELLGSAAAGDQAAWDSIVNRFSSLVWATARAHRLSHADAAEVAQTTWLRLVEHIDRLREPEKVGAWLATTARNESLRVIGLGAREQPTEDIDLFVAPADDVFDRLVLNRERDGALWRAFATLSKRCQDLLRLLVADEEPSYEEIAEALEMPIGSIGPTRGRCLERLRATVDFEELEIG